MVLNLILTNNNILSCFCFLILITDLYFLIHAAITRIFNHTEALPVPTGIPINKVKVEIKTHHVSAETKISNVVQCNTSFLLFLLINSLFISSKNNLFG